ncbi:predicted protein [Histoplasma mississippiense (nom. inval.)]|uniref:predicted protein n=1 Tax=Ajellomyces capsulatus (strain NAm1 / WU24) TaxID=2059318 RepID=UPI000157D339|nr:predicted protein [Histoplasma mississippiense (nom. inval.)]EDN04923.1 predicted protein [Histoplasma mississippiense (nom. inval.)]
MNPSTRWTQPVGRQTRWTSNPSQERINPLEVEHAGPKPVGCRTRWMRKSNALDPTRWTSNPSQERINPLGVEHAGPKPVGRRTRRSGYEIQHIQIKSDNSAGKGLHCGVKVNELRWGWNGRPFHLGLENLRKPTNQSRADWAYIPFGFRR